MKTTQDIRLTAKGREIGLVDDERWQAFNTKMEQIEAEKQRLRGQWVHPDHPAKPELDPMLKHPISREHSLEELIRRPEMTYDALMAVDGLGPGIEDKQAAEQVEIQIKYAGYIERQKDEIRKNSSSRKKHYYPLTSIMARSQACPTKSSQN